MHGPYAPTQPKNQIHRIRAELAGCDTATALGIVARSESPVLQLCLMLVEAGCHPATPLEAWRGVTLCLRVRCIGEAAGLKINGKGTDFVCRCAVGIAPPMRQNGWACPTPTTEEMSHDT